VQFGGISTKDQVEFFYHAEFELNCWNLIIYWDLSMVCTIFIGVHDDLCWYDTWSEADHLWHTAIVEHEWHISQWFDTLINLLEKPCNILTSIPRSHIRITTIHTIDTPIIITNFPFTGRREDRDPTSHVYII